MSTKTQEPQDPQDMEETAGKGQGEHSAREEGEDSAREEGWLIKIKKELTPQKNLIFLKVVLCLSILGLNGVLPFLTVHLREIGITYTELATIMAALPVTAIIGPPVLGFVADKTGHYKVVIIFNLLMTGVLSVMFLYVPARPSRILTFHCGPEGHSLTWSYCDLCHDARNDTELQLTLQDCTFACSSPPTDMKMCLTGANISSCLDLNVIAEVELNGTMLSSDDGETCSQSCSEVGYEGEAYRDLTCPDPSCPVTCQVTPPPPCHDPRDPANSQTTFWLYFTVRILWNLFGISSFTMLDAATLAILKERGGEYGKQRVLTIIASSLVPIISGALVDWYSQGKGYTDYTPAMYLSAAGMAVTALLVTRLRFTVEKQKRRVLEDLKQLVTKVEVLTFLLLVLLLGTNWGFMETFLFLYYQSLQAPNTLMGTSLLVSSICALPIVFLADKIVRKFGFHIVFAFAFLVYGFRELAYTFIHNPWVIVGLECVKPLAYNLPWNAMIILLPTLAPKGMLATMSGIVSPMHHTIGWSVGSVVGGYLVDSLGLAGSFRVMSYVSFGSAGVYVILYVTCLRRRFKVAGCTDQAEERDVMLEDKPQPPNNYQPTAPTNQPTTHHNHAHELPPPYTTITPGNNGHTSTHL